MSVATFSGASKSARRTERRTISHGSSESNVYVLSLDEIKEKTSEVESNNVTYWHDHVRILIELCNRAFTAPDPNKNQLELFSNLPV